MFEPANDTGCPVSAPGFAPGPTDTAAARFFNLLYGTTTGWIELSAIHGDPDDRDHCRFIQDWFAYNPQRLGELLAQVDALAQRYGNVYVSVNVYDRPRRNAQVRPGRVVFVDDLPLGTPASFIVRTSPTSRHGYFLLDQDTPIEARRDLARRAAAALGCDKSGSDDQQIARVPGTYNTKARAGGHHLVTLQLGQRQRYTLQELRAAWPELPTPAQISSDGLMCWADVEHWLGNISQLIGADGLPRRVKPNTQTGRTIRSGGLGNDRSLARYIVARGLILHGYPDAEIAALLWCYCDYGHGHEKGTAWLQADIARIIAKERALLPNVTPSATRAAAAQPAQPIIEIPRPKLGRTIVLTPARLLAFYDQERGASDVVLLTIGEVAQRLGVSRATIERCEKQLREQGAIERRPFNRRQSSLVAVLRPLKSPEHAPDRTSVHVPSQMEADRVPVPNLDANTIHGGTHPPEGAIALGPAVLAGAVPSGAGPWPAIWHAEDADYPVQVIEVAGVGSDGRVYVWAAGEDGSGKTGIPLNQVEFVQPAPAPPLTITVNVVTPRPRSADEWVYEAIVAIDTLQPVDVLDRETGEVKAIKRRVSRKRVKQYLSKKGIHVLPDVFDRVYPEQLERRTRERRIAALTELTPAALRAEIRLAEHMAEKSRSRSREDTGAIFGGRVVERCTAPIDNLYRWWEFYRDMARRELSSRPPDPTRPRRGRKVCEVLPDLRALGARRPQSLWDIVDDELADRRAGRGAHSDGATAGGVCSPQPTPEALPASGLGESSGAAQRAHLLASLWARKDSA